MKRLLLLLTWLLFVAILAPPPLAAQSFAVPCKTITATRAAVGKDSVQVQVTARCALLRDTLRLPGKTDTLRLPGRTDTLYLPAPKDSVVTPPPPPKDTVIVTPPPPPTTGTGYRAHEPTGYTTITDNPFNALRDKGWYPDTGSPKLAADATGITSPGSVFRSTFPAGFHAGSSPGKMEFDAGKTMGEIYLSMTFRLSSNWQGEASGTLKTAFVWVNGGPHLFLAPFGVGAASLSGIIQQQGPEKYNYPTTACPITRGAWHVWEVQLTSNRMRWWMDGKVCADIPASYPGRFGPTLAIDPIWGGVTGTVTNTMTFDVDHIYFSGK